MKISSSRESIRGRAWRRGGMRSAASILLAVADSHLHLPRPMVPQGYSPGPACTGTGMAVSRLTSEVAWKATSRDFQRARLCEKQ